MMGDGASDKALSFHRPAADQETIVRPLRFAQDQFVTGFAAKMRHIDRGDRIGRDNSQDIAWCQFGELLARPQDRERTA